MFVCFMIILLVSMPSLRDITCVRDRDCAPKCPNRSIGRCRKAICECLAI